MEIVAPIQNAVGTGGHVAELIANARSAAAGNRGRAFFRYQEFGLAVDPITLIAQIL